MFLLESELNVHLLRHVHGDAVSPPRSAARAFVMVRLRHRTLSKSQPRPAPAGVCGAEAKVRLRRPGLPVQRNIGPLSADAFPQRFGQCRVGLMLKRTTPARMLTSTRSRLRNLRTVRYCATGRLPAYP
jgi:hypothetical protein